MKTISVLFFIAILTYVISAIYEVKMLALFSLLVSFVCLICLLIIGYKNLMK